MIFCQLAPPSPSPLYPQVCDHSLCPQVCSPCVYLHCCSESRFISTIFLDSMLLLSHPVVSDSLWPPWTTAHQASLSLTISWSLPKFMFIASVMPSSYLILWCPLLLLPSIFSSIRDFSNESVCIRWPKYWSFSCSINPFNEYSGLISLKIVLIFLLSKELTGVFSSTTVQRHQLFGVLPFLQSSSHDHTWPLGRL